MFDFKNILFSFTTDSSVSELGCTEAKPVENHWAEQCTLLGW